jgi:catechol-2,3-dioxygenase
VSITVTRLAHVGLRTARRDEMERYLTDVLGLWECQRDADGVSHFTAGGAGSYIELSDADTAGLDHVALELAQGTDPAMVSEALAQEGVAVSPWSREDPGASESLSIQDPEGNAIQLIIPSGEMVEPATSTSGIRPLKFGHVATRVSDVRAVEQFYLDVLGFRWSDSIGETFTFLRCNADHHAVNFLQAERPGDVHHIAFELSDLLHTQRAADELSRNGISLIWGPGRHGPGHNLFTYHLDPEGRIIELFAGIDRMSHEGQGYFDPRPWQTHRPQRPMVWDPESLTAANAWGVPPPDSFMV